MDMNKNGHLLTVEQKKALAAKLAADLRAVNDRMDISKGSHSVDGFRVPRISGRYSFIKKD